MKYRSRQLLVACLAVGGVTGTSVAQDLADELDEILVTATGRIVAIQDVPVAVTVIGGTTLRDAGVENLLDLQQLAPGLRIGAGQSTALGTTGRIRGLGTSGDNPGFESALGFYVDGVYRARAGIAISDLPPVEQVEVLRGPQGTLFGRNTSSGAITVATQGPVFEPGAWFEAGVGDQGYRALRGGGNLPVGERVALRFDGAWRERDGFAFDETTDRDFNTQDRYLLRGQALLVLASGASLRIIADYTATDEDCCAATFYQYGPTQLVLDNRYLALAGAYAPFLPVFTGEGATLPATAGLPAAPDIVLDPAARRVSVSPGRDYLERVKDGGVSAQFDWRWRGADLTSITAYRSWRVRRNQDSDYNVNDLFNREGLTAGIDNFTQELRLKGEAGRLSWLLGALYAHEDLATTDRIRTGARASDYANALTFLQTAAQGAPRELFDLTDATVDGALGGDPVPSLLGLLNPALDQVYLLPNPAGAGQQADAWTQKTRDFALFTHNELSLNERLILAIGLRYSHSRRQFTGVLDAVLPGCDVMQALEGGFGLFSALNAAANGPPSAQQAQAADLRTLLMLVCSPYANTAANSGAADPWAAARTENELSGMASLRYHATAGLMLYGSYARGYKAGGFNLDRAGFSGLFPGMTPAQAGTLLDAGQLAYEPEFADSFELGARSTIFGGSTYLNLTLFHAVLRDFQLNAFNGVAFITRNVPRAVSRGVELDLIARPSARLSIQGGIHYTDARNDSTVAFVPNSPADTIVAGRPLIQAPKWTVTGAVGYDRPVGVARALRLHLDGRYDSAYQTQELGRVPISDQPPTLTLNARIAFGQADNRWTVEFWGRNLTDEFIAAGFNAPLQTGTIGAFVNEPRSWGVTLRLQY